MRAALGGELEERTCVGVADAVVDGAMGAPGALVIEQAGCVRYLDLRAAIVAAGVRGEDLGAIEDPYGVDRGEDFECSTHMGMGGSSSR